MVGPFAVIWLYEIQMGYNWTLQHWMSLRKAHRTPFGCNMMHQCRKWVQGVWSPFLACLHKFSPSRISILLILFEPHIKYKIPGVRDNGLHGHLHYHSPSCVDDNLGLLGSHHRPFVICYVEVFFYFFLIFYGFVWILFLLFSCFWIFNCNPFWSVIRHIKFS